MGHDLLLGLQEGADSLSLIPMADTRCPIADAREPVPHVSVAHQNGPVA